MIPASRRRVGPIYRSPTGSRRCDRRATARRHRSVAPRLVYDGVRRAEVQEESKPDSVRGGHLSRPCGRSPQATAPYPGLGEQRHRPCFGLQRGRLPVSPRRSVRRTRLCGSNRGLPHPGLRQAPCSALSGLSSATRAPCGAGRQRPPFFLDPVRGKPTGSASRRTGSLRLYHWRRGPRFRPSALPRRRGQSVPLASGLPTLAGASGLGYTGRVVKRCVACSRSCR